MSESAHPAAATAGPAGRVRIGLRERLQKRFPLHAREIQLYRVCEDITSALVYPLLIASPWAFGSTWPEIVRVLNGVGFVLGALFLLKLWIRAIPGYAPPRWDQEEASAGSWKHPLAGPFLTRCLGLLTLAILGYSLTSALNARSTYLPDGFSITEHGHVNWLPHSFNRPASWFAIWTNLGLAGSFWAIRDWLLGKIPAESRASDLTSERPILTARIRRVLWLLAINTTLLGLESIIQRLANTPRLLFVFKTPTNPYPIAQFGPYSYRGNAANYFNLVWPLCLGLWLAIQRRAASMGRRAHHVLLPIAGFLAACPIISTSRAGALTSVAMAALALAGLLISRIRHPHRPGERATRVPLPLLLVFLAVMLGLGWHFGWKNLSPRLGEMRQNYAVRAEIYATSRQIIADYPVYGIGPGCFETIFQLYRKSPDQYWPVRLHNDFLETLITFGGAGSALIALAFGVVVARWFAPGQIHGSRKLAPFLWLGMGGCFLQAAVDFPFQVHSIVLLFLVHCTILSCLSGRRTGV